MVESDTWTWATPKDCLPIGPLQISLLRSFEGASATVPQLWSLCETTAHGGERAGGGESPLKGLPWEELGRAVSCESCLL